MTSFTVPTVETLCRVWRKHTDCVHGLLNRQMNLAHPCYGCPDFLTGDQEEAKNRIDHQLRLLEREILKKPYDIALVQKYQQQTMLAEQYPDDLTEPHNKCPWYLEINLRQKPIRRRFPAETDKVPQIDLHNCLEAMVL